MSPQSAGQSLRERIRLRQPIRLPLRLYAVGWMQGLIQLAVFAGALALLQGETQPVPVLLLSVAFGWAWFCLLMIGHDASHNAFVPWRWINQVIAFLTLDCLLFSRASWLYGHHVIHHSRPFSKEDRMYLSATSVAGDMWNLLGMVLTYVVWDVKRLVQRPTWYEWLGMTVRVTLLWLLAPLALVPAIVFLLLFGNYLGLLSHSLPVARRTVDPVLRQLRTTWDLYPGSFIASLLTGGLNAHATHHVYPSLPRGAQPLATRILLEEAGAEYRRVRTLAGLWTLFRLRQYRTHEVASIEAIAANRLSLGIALLPSLEVRITPQVLAPQTAAPLAVSAPAPVDLRKGERRLAQLTISFPDRRQGDRRRASAQAAA
jgi:fatty acid desaturase